jgi:hypothetical protein
MNQDPIPLSLQRRVRERAGDRCEYCRISQRMQEATFHVDHIRPRREGGPNTAENLALACVSCSLRKGARTYAEDPGTGNQTPLFHPRRDRWEEHFHVAEDMMLLGKSPTGRATIEMLRLNRKLAIEIRREEALRGRYP